MESKIFIYLVFVMVTVNMDIVSALVAKKLTKYLKQFDYENEPGKARNLTKKTVETLRK